MTRPFEGAGPAYRLAGINGSIVMWCQTVRRDSIPDPEDDDGE